MTNYLVSKSSPVLTSALTGASQTAAWTPVLVPTEVSHAAARTRDVAYSIRGAAILAKDDPVSAANNADNYEYFVESLRR